MPKRVKNVAVQPRGIPTRQSKRQAARRNAVTALDFDPEQLKLLKEDGEKEVKHSLPQRIPRAKSKKTIRAKSKVKSRTKSRVKSTIARRSPTTVRSTPRLKSKYPIRSRNPSVSSKASLQVSPIGTPRKRSISASQVTNYRNRSPSLRKQTLRSNIVLATPVMSTPKPQVVKSSQQNRQSSITRYLSSLVDRSTRPQHRYPRKRSPARTTRRSSKRTARPRWVHSKMMRFKGNKNALKRDQMRWAIRFTAAASVALLVPLMVAAYICCWQDGASAAKYLSFARWQKFFRGGR